MPKVAITIANRIDRTDLFVNKAGVLDWSTIPAEDAFRFVTGHEIAHVIHVDHGLYLEMAIDGVLLGIKRRPVPGLSPGRGESARNARLLDRVQGRMDGTELRARSLLVSCLQPAGLVVSACGIARGVPLVCAQGRC